MLDELDHPQLRGFLPMIYIAWADGDLEDEELRDLQERVRKHVWLEPKAKETLSRWLDPQKPPSPVALAQLLRQIQTASGNMSSDRRYGLTELGLSMAAHSEAAAPDEVRTALQELEGALGICPDQGSVALRGQPREAPSEKGTSVLDVSALTEFLDRAPGHGGDAELKTRSDVRQFLSQADYRAFDAPRPVHRQQVLDWLVQLADRGIGGLSYPGVTSEVENMAPFMAAFETLGHGNLSLCVKFGVQFGLFGGSIYFLGTEEQQKRYLPDTAAMKLPGCYAMSELGHGSNVMDLETTAVFKPETGAFELHTPSESARKEWIGNAADHGHMATVFAQLEVGGEQLGVHAFLVPIRNDDGTACEGVRIGDCGPKMGLEGVDNGRLWFNQVKVPRENLLGRYASVDEEGKYHSPIPSPNKRFFTMLGTLVAGRICVGAAGLSAAKTGMAIAVRYGNARRQFGGSGEPEVHLLDYRTHQRRLLPRLAGLYAMHFAIAKMRGDYLNAPEEDARRVEATAAGLKAYLSSHASDTLRECREACGGQGYLKANRLPELVCDEEIFKTFEGDNTVLLQLVAKGLLTSYQRQFADRRFMTVLKYLAKRAAVVVAEKNPFKARWTDVDHLRDGAYHQALFEAREESLLSSVAMRLKKRMDAGKSSFDAFLETQDHLVALGLAHAERMVRQAFHEAVEGCEDAALKPTLENLLDLWTLWRLETDASWFLENGFFESGKLGAIREQVNSLAAAVRPDARALVDAFAIPDACLGASIAFGDPGYRGDAA
ncbi:MAG: acyl-CoA dehydrogenase [Myxococcota bacterium]